MGGAVFMRSFGVWFVYEICCYVSTGKLRRAVFSEGIHLQHGLNPIRISHFVSTWPLVICFCPSSITREIVYFAQELHRKPGRFIAGRDPHKQPGRPTSLCPVNYLLDQPNSNTLLTHGAVHKYGDHRRIWLIMSCWNRSESVAMPNKRLSCSATIVTTLSPAAPLAALSCQMASGYDFSLANVDP